MLSHLNQFNSVAVLLVQVVVGVIFIVHGLFKMKGKNPTFGIGGLFHGLVEVVGGALLVLGLLVAPVSLVFAVIMLGAIYFKIFKWKTPFFAHNASGWEFDLILLAILLWLATL